MKTTYQLQSILLAVGISAIPPAHGEEAVTSTGTYPANISDRNSTPIRGGWTSYTTYAGTVGTTVNVGASNVLVTALGFYDGPDSADANNSATPFGDGLLESHEVGIYDSNGNLLTEAMTIPSGTGATLVGEFRYMTLVTPITLLAGQNYTIAGQIPTVSGLNSDVFRDDDFDSRPGVFTFGAGLTKDTSGNHGANPRSYTGPPSINPNYNDGIFAAPNNQGTGYAAGNFQYTVVDPPVPPDITSITREISGDLTILFSGAPNTNYSVTKSPDLITSFVPLDSPLTATTDGSGNGEATVPAVEASEPREFYRIEE